jgi:hypothetical protein
VAEHSYFSISAPPPEPVEAGVRSRIFVISSTVWCNLSKQSEIITHKYRRGN